MDNQETNKLAEILGLDKMPEGQKDELLKRVGDVVIDASVGRLLLTLNEEQVLQLNESLGELTEDKDVFALLLKKYPDFEHIVKEEIKALQDETEKVFSE